MLIYAVAPFGAFSKQSTHSWFGAKRAKADIDRYRSSDANYECSAWQAGHLAKNSNIPIRPRPIVVVQLRLLTAIAPVEFLIRRVRGRLCKLIVADVNPIGLLRRVEFELGPWDRHVFFADAQEAAKAQDRVGHAAADLVDHEPLYRADLFATRAEYGRAF